MEHTAWTGAWTCSTEIQQLHAKRTCSKDMQHGRIAWTGNIDKQPGQKAWTYSTDMQRGHARTCSMDKQSEHAAGTYSKVIQHGHAGFQFQRHASQTCTIDMGMPEYATHQELKKETVQFCKKIEYIGHTVGLGTRKIYSANVNLLTYLVHKSVNFCQYVNLTD
jgi:hypothetical protein